MTTIPPDESTYVFDAEQSEEVARLTLQDRFLTKEMGGPLVGIPDPSTLHDVLDVACGPGGWASDVAYELSKCSVTGIDNSESLLEYARMRAKAQGLENATFCTMNILQPLEFPDNSFDLVNARMLFAVLHREAWPAFIAECVRVLRPGGYLRLTEPSDVGQLVTPAAARMQMISLDAFWRIGYGFSPDGSSLGLTPVLPRLVRAAHIHNVHLYAHALETSPEIDSWSNHSRNYQVVIQQIKVLAVKMGLISQEEMDDLYQQILYEMNSDDFCSIWHFVTIVGQK
jgi:ubiquinone/menaquinone biosynthesis C-methylase UbiE